MAELDDYVHAGPRYSKSGYKIGHGQGMSMRDYFAGQADGLADDADDLYADIFNKDQKPPKDDYLAWAKWFAKADATLRYIRADAMLEARKTTGEGEA